VFSLGGDERLGQRPKYIRAGQSIKGIGVTYAALPVVIVDRVLECCCTIVSNYASFADNLGARGSGAIDDHSSSVTMTKFIVCTPHTIPILSANLLPRLR
jgi:hypothetical protein